MSHDRRFGTSPRGRFSLVNTKFGTPCCRSQSRIRIGITSGTKPGRDSARVVTQYDDVALYPPAYFHPTVGETKSNPDAKGFLKAAHLFAGTWVVENRLRHCRLWEANA